MEPRPHQEPLEATDLFEVMATTRAIRRYRPDPVPDDILRTCLEAATWAPSGSNRQAWRFLVLRSPEVRALLGTAYRQGWDEKAAQIRSADPAPDDDSPRARMVRSMQHFVDHIEEVPVYVLFCMQGFGDGPAVFMDGASIYPAMQNFCLALRAHGLGTVVTAWWMHCEAELRQVVGVPDDWSIAALLPVGYPVGAHGPLRRKPVEQVTYRERWGTPLL
jgi:nitroreductase